MTNIYRQYKDADNPKSFEGMIREVSIHQDRMTVEDLRSKVDIAFELAYRDMEIKRLKAELAKAKNAWNNVFERVKP